MKEEAEGVQTLKIMSAVANVEFRGLYRSPAIG